VAALFADPRHAGRPEPGGFCHGAGGAVKAGARIELWLEIRAGRIEQARFEAFGCPATIASGEWLCRWLTGRESQAAAQLTGIQLADALAVDAAKRSVALIAEDALKAALAGCAQNESEDIRR
jgi:NifU-like protein involved in Fe-S cluster formation